MANRTRFHALSADAVKRQTPGIDYRDGRSRGGILHVGEKGLVKGKNTLLVLCHARVKKPFLGFSTQPKVNISQQT